MKYLWLLCFVVTMVDASQADNVSQNRYTVVRPVVLTGSGKTLHDCDPEKQKKQRIFEALVNKLTLEVVEQSAQVEEFKRTLNRYRTLRNASQ